MRIVVVDDEPALCTLITDLLQADGHEVRAAQDPYVALQVWGPERDVDLFVIDIMLPGMDGIDLARRLDDAGNAEIPKIAVSASRARLQQASDSTLFAGTLVKPFDIDELFDCIEQSVRAYRQVASA